MYDKCSDCEYGDIENLRVENRFLKEENEKLKMQNQKDKEVINKAMDFINREIEIIKEQPSKNKSIDEYILLKYNGLLIFLKEVEK